MSNDPNTTSKNNDLMGISFNEIHSDESHEEVTPHKSETTVASVPQKKMHTTNRENMFDVSKAFDDTQVEHGTIVTDRRHTRPSFGKNLQSAFIEWWGNAKKTVASLEHIPLGGAAEEPEIKKAENRIGIIQEAATYTAQAPKDDHAIVVEKLKTYNRDVAKVTGKTFVIKQPERKKSAWMHTVPTPERGAASKTVSRMDVSVPDMRTKMVAPVIAKHIKGFVPDANASHKTLSEKIPQSTFVPSLEKRAVASETPSFSVAPLVQNVARIERLETQEPLRQSAVLTDELPAQKETSVQKYAERAEALVSPEPVKRAPVTPPQIEITPLFTPERSEASVPDMTFRTNVPVPQPETIPLRPTPTFPKSIPNVSSESETLHFDRASFAVAPAENNGLRIFIKWGLLVGIVILGIALALFASIHFNIFEQAPVQERETIIIPAFFEVSSSTPIVLQESPNAFLASLSNQILKTSVPLHQFYPLIESEGGKRAATSEEFFNFLKTHLETRVARTLDDTFMIGSVNTAHAEPFIILRSYSFDMLFSGFLAWEPFMYEDLRPLLGNTNAPATHFVDAVAHNTSVRILYDEQGNEVLMYSFINQNTVVVTTSGEALSKLIEHF